MQSFLGISNHFLQRAMVAKHVKMHAYCWLSGINRKELNCVTKYIYLLKKGSSQAFLLHHNFSVLRVTSGYFESVAKRSNQCDQNNSYN